MNNKNNRLLNFAKSTIDKHNFEINNLVPYDDFIFDIDNCYPKSVNKNFETMITDFLSMNVDDPKYESLYNELLNINHKIIDNIFYDITGSYLYKNWQYGLCEDVFTNISAFQNKRLRLGVNSTQIDTTVLNKDNSFECCLLLRNGVIYYLCEDSKVILGNYCAYSVKKQIKSDYVDLEIEKKPCEVINSCRDRDSEQEKTEDDDLVEKIRNFDVSMCQKTKTREKKCLEKNDEQHVSKNIIRPKPFEPTEAYVDLSKINIGDDFVKILNDFFAKHSETNTSYPSNKNLETGEKHDFKYAKDTSRFEEDKLIDEIGQKNKDFFSIKDFDVYVYNDDIKIPLAYKLKDLTDVSIQEGASCEKIETKSLDPRKILFQAAVYQLSSVLQDCNQIIESDDKIKDDMVFRCDNVYFLANFTKDLKVNEHDYPIHKSNKEKEYVNRNKNFKEFCNTCGCAHFNYQNYHEDTKTSDFDANFVFSDAERHQKCVYDDVTFTLFPFNEDRFGKKIKKIVSTILQNKKVIMKPY
ncbi:hypothetical protein EDEG_02099 [Edhazardia aedis USNM 41457]|uniref:Uncharacterized protein n=1 Tax=Edhazardia aedis (strain USNM 41457) TaxID=1003232 RepID=J9DQK5_EDHAE|nr:hypothetical protein EDEG_02099 [Edhazardia aedis USNM 41457]|eukprot:EJW03587.1 hypothetical protein EDEG_02099 [Edhazardia aedis USNM 41457]